MVARYELTESQWKKIEIFLPGKTTDRGRTGGTIDYLRTDVCGLYVAERCGIICRSAAGRGKGATTVFVVEHMPLYGKKYLRCF